MIEIRPYKYEDALKLEPKEKGVKSHPDYETWAKMNENGPAYTIVIDGEIIGCAGIRVFWEGTGEAWAILAEDKSVKHLKLIMEEFGKRLDYTIRTLKFRWVQATINKDNAKLIHWVQHFGFKRKCIMTGYLPGGNDAFLYARENE